MSNVKVEILEDEYLKEYIHVHLESRSFSDELISKLIDYVTNNRLSVCTGGAGKRWSEVFIYGIDNGEVQEHIESVRRLLNYGSMR